MARDVGRELAVDEDVDLHGRAGNGARYHENQDRAQGRVPEIELPLVAEAEFPERGKLHAQLRQSAKQNTEAPAHDRAFAKMRMKPMRLGFKKAGKKRAPNDRDNVEDGARAGRDAENVTRIEHAHDGGGQRNEKNEREKNPRHLHGQRKGLRLFRAPTATGEVDDLRTEDDANHADETKDERQGRENKPRKMPRGGFALLLPCLGEGGGEGGRKRALGKKIAQQIRDPEGRDEGVGEHRRAEHEGKDLFAHHAHQSRAHDGSTDNQRRLLRAALFRRDRRLADRLGTAHLRVARLTAGQRGNGFLGDGRFLGR